MADTTVAQFKKLSESSSSELVERLRFPPEEEARLVSESNAQKIIANKRFATSDYSSAIGEYNKALSTCPSYLDYEIAILRSNIAACHLKLQEWKSAINSAAQALDCLDSIDPPADNSEGAGSAGCGQVEEVDDETASRMEKLQSSGHSLSDVQKLRTKALLRRAKARMEMGGWATLAGAEEDYKTLSGMPNLTQLDRQSVDTALRRLPPLLEAAKSKEMGEMMGKLKDLGNGLLKPFGLSTDSFNFIKDESSGGYSMQLNQNN